MTNDEFILAKKQDKLNQSWERLNRLFDSQQEISISNLTFHRRKIKNKYYISCTSRGKHTILLTKKDLEQAFVYNKEYAKELNVAIRNQHEKKLEGNGVNYFYKGATIKKEILQLTYEEKYIICLLAKCGCNLN